MSTPYDDLTWLDADSDLGLFAALPPSSSMDIWSSLWEGMPAEQVQSPDIEPDESLGISMAAEPVAPPDKRAHTEEPPLPLDELLVQLGFDADETACVLNRISPVYIGDIRAAIQQNLVVLKINKDLLYWVLTNNTTINNQKQMVAAIHGIADYVEDLKSRHGLPINELKDIMTNLTWSKKTPLSGAQKALRETLEKLDEQVAGEQIFFQMGFDAWKMPMQEKISPVCPKSSVLCDEHYAQNLSQGLEKRKATEPVAPPAKRVGSALPKNGFLKQQDVPRVVPRTEMQKALLELGFYEEEVVDIQKNIPEEFFQEIATSLFEHMGILKRGYRKLLDWVLGTEMNANNAQHIKSTIDGIVQYGPKLREHALSLEDFKAIIRHPTDTSAPLRDAYHALQNRALELPDISEQNVTNSRVFGFTKPQPPPVKKTYAPVKKTYTKDELILGELLKQLDFDTTEVALVQWVISPEYIRAIIKAIQENFERLKIDKALLFWVLTNKTNKSNQNKMAKAITGIATYVAKLKNTHKLGTEVLKNIMTNPDNPSVPLSGANMFLKEKCLSLNATSPKQPLPGFLASQVGRAPIDSLPSKSRVLDKTPTKIDALPSSSRESRPPSPPSPPSTPQRNSFFSLGNDARIEEFYAFPPLDGGAV